jgi:prepilin-type N-terminal cleavage/methylation domain-containing protein
MKRPTSHHHHAGVTLTELLLVLLIVGLLATLAVPTVTRRARDARVAAALADAKAIAEAQMTCGLIHGFFVPLQLLDNLPRNNDPESDHIGNESTVFVVNVNQPVLQQLGNQLTVESSDLEDNWQGPFYQAQRVYVDDPNNPFQVQTLRHDFPLDPWGRPYFLYSPLGVVGTTAGSVAAAGTLVTETIIRANPASWGNGQLTNQNDRFDRWAIVSFGPDGVAGDVNGSPTDLGDDIIYFFGGDAGTTGSV